MKSIPYGRQTINREDIKAVISVLKLIGLPRSKVKEFEGALANTPVQNMVVVSSGTAALHIACLSAGLKSGDEAITSPPITFVWLRQIVFFIARLNRFLRIFRKILLILIPKK